MKVLIIGAGASGVMAAISIKTEHPEDEVLIIERLDKPLKKILATGNGKCNLGNASIDKYAYNHPLFVKPILKEYGYYTQKDFFKEIGVETKLIDNLAYPVSESAITVRDALLTKCARLGIKINVNEKLIDYSVCKESIKVTTDKNTYLADRLIIAAGGKSAPKLGSEGSIFKILEKHGYMINEVQPGLCPIKVNENTKILDGTRVKAKVSLYKNHHIIHQEKGEVLFKNDGLSGIVIMNVASLIARNVKASYVIELDILDEYPEEEVADYIIDNGEEQFLHAFLHPKMIEYFKSNRIKGLYAKRLAFTYKSLYDFEFSQVSVGGVDVIDVDENLQSKREKNVFFTGEVLDIDGPCGGYNLTWAFATGMKMK